MKIILKRAIFFVLFFYIKIISVSAFSGGTGTYNDPYQVNNLNDLNDVRNYLSSYFIQTDDISIGFNYNLPLGWLPIGDATNPFTGHYNGNGYVIMAMKINRPSTNYIGLFGYTYCATIQGVTISDSEVNGDSNVGLLVGYAEGTSEKSGLIYNCSVHASSEGNYYVGGLIGGMQFINVDNCNSSADVLGRYDYVGGLIGVSSYSNISSCTRTTERDITGSSIIGGLIGYNECSTISYCDSYDRMRLSGESTIGGLVGWNTKKSIIEHSHVEDGSIDGINEVGGLVGKHDIEAIIYHCNVQNFNENPYIEGECMVGGLVGKSYDSEISESFVYNSIIIGEYCLGGLVGHADESEVHYNNVYTVNTYGIDYVGMIIGTILNCGYSNNSSSSSNYYCSSGTNCGDPFGYQGDCPCNSKKRILKDNITNETDLQIYPNPTKNFLQIESKLNIESIKIINTLGKVVYSNRIDAQIYTLNTSDLKSGIYFIQLETSEEIFNRIFIIDK